MDESDEPVPGDYGYRMHELAAKITPLRPATDGQRAERIRDVVDAFVRLRGSVFRFTAMLARDAAAEPPASALSPPVAPSFGTLLALLAQLARQAGFARLPELDQVIELAAQAEVHRDVIFMQSPAASEVMLCSAATELERLDAAFIGLCVEHVIERHAQARSRAVAAA
jgi:hypothetical protein